MQKAIDARIVFQGGIVPRLIKAVKKLYGIEQGGINHFIRQAVREKLDKMDKEERRSKGKVK